MSSGDHEILSYLITGSIWGVIDTYIGIRILRQIKDTPTSKIRSAAQGYCEIHGKVQNKNNNIVNSLLSKKPCVWYMIIVSVKVGSGRNAYWKQVHTQFSQPHFMLNDNGSTCFISPLGANFKGLTEFCYKYQHNPPIYTTVKKDTIEQKVIEQIDYSFKKALNYQFEEVLIEPETYLYAMGNFKTINQTKKLYSVDKYEGTDEEKLNKLQHFFKYNAITAEFFQHPIVNNSAVNQLNDEIKSMLPNGSGSTKHNAINILWDPPHTKKYYMISKLPLHKLIKKNKLRILRGAAFFIICNFCLGFYAVMEGWL